MSVMICRFSMISIFVLFLLGGIIQGQSRIAIPTQIPADSAGSAGATGWTSAGTPSILGAPNAPYSSGGNLIAPPSMPGAVTSPVSPPGSISPGGASAYPGIVRPAVSPASPNPQTYVSPGTSYTQPGAVSPFVNQSTAPPTGSYSGPYVPPSPGMDPYATPGGTTAPLFSQDPYFNYGSPAIPYTAMTKFLQDIRLDYHWFLGHGNNQLGINDFDLSATFAIPFLDNPNTPILVTPGFGLQLWEGPISIAPAAPGDPPAADLPPQTYDGYIDTAWKPQISPAFGGELSFRVGIYSDFTTTTTSSIRYTGTALGVVNLTPSFKLKAGVMYLDRLQIKLLPSGGIVWTPNPDIEFAILFPNPKIRKRWTNFGSVEWWMYAAGDYGGGSWTIKRANIPGVSDPAVAGQNDAFDYDDIRVSVGLEFLTPRNFNGFFEVGGAFSRQLHYRSGFPDNYYPNNTVFLRAGMSY